MLRVRPLITASCVALVLLFIWTGTSAQDQVKVHPAQDQIRQILPSLRDSEAEHASGAYVPGMGTIITLDLIRGPNSIADRTPADSTRDWAIYLMQTFGSQLTAVPADERIAFSIEFYNYGSAAYQQLVITSKPADVADPNRYAIWLDGEPFGGAAPTASSDPTVPPQTSPAPTYADLAQPARFRFDDPADAEQWIGVSGTWIAANGGYAQTEVERFDLVTLLNQPISGPYTFKADVKFIDGEMGAGLIFNAPTTEGKPGAQMISFTGNGTYLQWGAYDAGGVFRFQGGSGVASTADDQWHTLRVEVSNASYTVSLDGTMLGRDVPLQSKAEGYVGLLASTSHVVFDNVAVQR